MAIEKTEEEILLIKLCKGLKEICDRINRKEPAYQVENSQPFTRIYYVVLLFNILNRMHFRAIFI